ncbi:MAG: ABC transporter substrate-binding protein [Deltaproteobacteria bacterium]|nr:ABC transporter substrate-binding protein [Deltaproteobacteria bacterium]MBW2015746.1 ABC transporter substrate-binding protein [Deltaproteobacteria bacterium]MBW2128685.1 ABC transporter substrate-binding protein [Deltaproteobacteria bacterium]MBW2302736.1 ABC transporter substrate-binding protein [Deltaproteobacteria bacterium]
MKEKRENKGVERKGMNRREFMKKGAIAVGAAVTSGLVFPGSARRAEAAKRDYILIGRPNPTTGPLASFGEGTPWTDERALAEINRDGGIYLKELGKKLPVKIKVVDTESNPTKAAEVASRLIVKDKVDLMVFYHTPDTVNPISSICERYRVPGISLDSPLEPWLEGGPYKWVFHAFWSVEKDIVPAYIGMWEKLNTNKVVGILMGNDPDGVSWSATFKKALEPRGYKVVDLGRFPYGMQDFSSFIDGWKKEKVEIILGNMIPPDFVTAWRQCHRLGFIPKAATIGKAILFPSAVAALGGDLPNGLTTEVWWSPHHPFSSSLAGYSAKELCDAWTKATGKQPLATLGYKYAGYEILADVLTRAGSLDKKKIRKAIAETRLNTMVGPIQYNEQNYSRTPVVGGQWVKGDKFPWEIKIVYNGEHPNIPLTGEIFPIRK